MGNSKQSSATQQFKKHPFQLSIEELVQHLGGINLEHGLTRTQINELRSIYGENKLNGEVGVKWYAVLFKQVSNAMILVRDYLELTLIITWIYRANMPHCFIHRFCFLHWPFLTACLTILRAASLQL